MKRLCISLVASLLLAGCAGTPNNAQPVANFELDRYLGKWYEIARLDNRFERGLEHITAQYSLRKDGGVRVINRGYKVAKQEWQQAEGRAYFVENPQTGHLKVSFFGPFYGPYIVFELGEQYEYAMVAGPNTEYLWILSRTPTLSDGVKTQLLKQAEIAGFDSQALIFVDHTLEIDNAH